MSRRYDMTVYVSEHDATKLDDIRDAIQEQWGLNDEWESPSEGYVFHAGEANLCGGEGEEEFSHRMAKAIWAAAGRCRVTVRCTYLDDPPHEDYLFEPEDYDVWKKTESSAGTASKS